MTAYLVQNPPRRSQFRAPRRAKPTGTVVLHSAENAPDLVLPDEGAERIARFIRDRTDPGSYHVICDQDSQVLLVPFGYEAFGDGTGSNPWGIHLSLALRASDWPKLNDQQRLWFMASLATAARQASDWLKAHHNVSVPVRRLTKASAVQPGFCSHQDREDWFGTRGRRTDPWRNDPVMWHLFLTLYEDTAAPAAPTPKQENDDMALLVKGDKSPHWWITDGLHKDYIESQEIANILAFAGLVKWNDGGPHVLPQSFVDSIPTVAKPTTAEQIKAALSGLGDAALTDAQVTAIIDAIPPKVVAQLGEKLRG